MLQHFIFWRSGKVQQDSYLIMRHLQMCRAATEAHPTATVQGCRNCHVWECRRPAEERSHAHLPHTESDGHCWRGAGGKEVKTRGAGSEWAVRCQGALASLESLDLEVGDSLGFTTREMWWLGAAGGKERRGKACGSEWFPLGVSSGACRGGYTGCSSPDRAQGMAGIRAPAPAGCWAQVCPWLTKTYWLKPRSEMLLAGKAS